MRLYITFSMRLNSIFRLNAASEPLQVGDQVTVDGMQGRGVVIAMKNKRVVVRFRNGEYLSRNQVFVHKIRSDYQSEYYSGRR